VAGKELVDGKCKGWIRPVSDRPTGELSESDRWFENGKDPKLLDIVTIPMTEPRPHGFQKENHLIDGAFYWTKDGEASWDTLQSALDSNSKTLWSNSSSSYNGTNDRVEEAVANQLRSSLLLIEVSDLTITVGVEGAEFGNGKRKVRGQFTYNGTIYRLAITDPLVERAYFGGSDGAFKVNQAILCVSLGEVFGGFSYKLIAGVFVKT
jgi:hypothetical protein